MNKKQLVVMWIGIIIIVMMGIFPPWVSISTIRNPETIFGDWTTTKRYYYGYNPIWKGIGDSYEVSHPAASIDFHRLGLQWAITAVFTGGFMVTFKNKKPKDEKDNKQIGTPSGNR